MPPRYFLCTDGYVRMDIHGIFHARMDMHDIFHARMDMHGIFVFGLCISSECGNAHAMTHLRMSKHPNSTESYVHLLIVCKIQTQACGVQNTGTDPHS